MGEINVYKIFEDKYNDFLEEYTNHMDLIKNKSIDIQNILCNVLVYYSNRVLNKESKWKWLLKECDYNGEIETKNNQNRAIVIIKKSHDIYVFTFGLVHFLVEKYCVENFGFDFFKRVKIEEFKRIASNLPNSKINKKINSFTYIGYDQFDFESGESYIKIKANLLMEQEHEFLKKQIEVGKSIKFNTKIDGFDVFYKIIAYIEEVKKQKELYKIPLLTPIKNQELIEKLNDSLQNKIDENFSIVISEFDVIGASEVFYNGDYFTEIRLKNYKKEISGNVTKECILDFLNEHNLDVCENILNIKLKVDSNKGGYTVSLKELIDYTDEDNKCLLLQGKWYKYNDDYISFLHERLSEIEIIHDEAFDNLNEYKDDFIYEEYKCCKDCEEYSGMQKELILDKLRKKFYREYYFNTFVSKKYNFILKDRDITSIKGQRIEYMDLVKDDMAISVKIGDSSSSLCYVCDQSSSLVNLIKSKNSDELKGIKSICIWLVFTRKRKLKEVKGKPDITQLNMLVLKNRINEWVKTVREAGLKPCIYINYI